MNLEALQKDLERRFPFGIPRNKLKEATGGVLNAHTASNLDSRGFGIPDRFFIGNRTFYPVKSVIEYIEAKIMANP